MRHSKNRSCVYAPYFPSFVETEHVRFGISGLKTLGRMLYSFEARKRMGSLIDDVRPDLCHIHNIYTQLSPSILDALRARKIPVMMTVHDHHLISPSYNIWADGCGPDVRRLGIVSAARSRFHKDSFAASFAQASAFRFHRWLRIYDRAISLFIAPSEFMKRQLVQAGFSPRKIRVNPYGIATEKIAPSFDHQKYFLFVGRLSEEKGIETILETARALPDIAFKIVGTGPEEDRLHAFAHGLPNVEFLGFQSGEDLQKWYRGATALLLPSRVQEVFPLVILEAMAYGKPVIASNVGGVSEVLEDRHTGLLVKPLDERGWREAVARLFEDEDERLFLAENARLAAETRFHSNRHWNRLKDIYEELVGEGEV